MLSIDHSKEGVAMLKQECRKVDLAESLISSATRRQFAVRVPCTAYWFSPTPRRQLLHPTSTEICFFPGLRRTQHRGRRALTATRTTICIRTLTLDNYCLHRTPSTLHTSVGAVLVFTKRNRALRSLPTQNWCPHDLLLAPSG